MKVDPRWKVRGCAIKKKLDEERAERAEGKRTGPTLGDIWLGKTSTLPLGEVGFGFRPTLGDMSSKTGPRGRD